MFRCAFSNCPEAIETDIYNRPIRKFIRGQSDGYNSVWMYKKSGFVNDVVHIFITVCLLAIIFLTIMCITIKIIENRHRYKRVVMISDILTQSKSVKEDFTYNKLKENSVSDL